MKSNRCKQLIHYAFLSAEFLPVSLIYTVWLTNMYYIMFISLFMVKTVNCSMILNGWNFYMQFRYINLLTLMCAIKNCFAMIYGVYTQEIAVLREKLQTILKWVESSLQPFLFISKISTNTDWLLTEIQ